MAMRRMVASNGSSVEKLGASKLNNAQLGCWIHASSEVNAHAEQLAGQAGSLAQEAILRRGADWAHVQGLILQGGIEEGSVIPTRVKADSFWGFQSGASQIPWWRTGDSPCGQGLHFVR